MLYEGTSLEKGGETTEKVVLFFCQMWSEYAKKEQAHHSLPQTTTSTVTRKEGKNC